jgi:phage baseplate assembly protein W
MAKGDARAFLGTGWAFPPQVDVRGELSTVSYEDDIRQAIRIILATSPGERVMRPDFGAGLNALMFEPINTTTMTLARRRVEEALTIWEPRVDHVTVKVTDEARLGRLLIDIEYRVRATNTFYNLVYPFYLLEGEQTR